MKYLNKQEFKQQEGVAILISVLLISGIAIISSTIAFFLIQEVRSNRATYLTEPAIIGAESAAERGIYNLKRGSTVTSCNSNPAFTNIDPGSRVRYRNCLTATKATFQFDHTQDLILYLYDPANINGNFCMENDLVCPADGNGTGTQLYTSLNVQHISGGIVTVTLESFDQLWTTTRLVNPGALERIEILRNLPNSNDERIRITISSGGPATVQIDAGFPPPDPRGIGIYQGLPNYTTIDAEACYPYNVSGTTCDMAGEVYTRRVNVTVPQ